MSHSKKKFLSIIQTNINNPDKLFSKSSKEKRNINLKDYDSGFFLNEDNEMIMCFLYDHKGKPLLIPEPDLTILYFTFVEKSIDHIVGLRNQILELAGDQMKDLEISENIANLFYDFFQLSSNFVINLFISLEAFNNSLIPNDHTYINKKGKKYSREGIQRSIKFEEKLKRVIPQLFKKSFVVVFNKKFELLREMKNLRDDVIHIKNFSKDFYVSYKEMFTKYLEFDFENALLYTKEYINYYKINHIEDCNCGED